MREIKKFKAITIKEISGRCIETISIGTKLEIWGNGANAFYNVVTDGFGVTSVWKDEIEIIGPSEQEPDFGPLKIKKIVPQTVEVYYKNVLVGIVNEYEFYDLRLQIKNGNIDGYFVLFNGEKISINPNGYTDKWPSGFFDLTIDQLSKL